MDADTIKTNISDALLARHPAARSVDVVCTGPGHWVDERRVNFTVRTGSGATDFHFFSLHSGTPPEALSAAAVAIGLNADGTDPFTALCEKIALLARQYESNGAESRKLAEAESVVGHSDDARTHSRDARWSDEIADDLRAILERCHGC